MARPNRLSINFSRNPRILRDPASQERFAVLGLEIIASTPQEFRASIESEIQRWAKVVKEANIKAE